jgi:hypothetical protein
MAITDNTINVLPIPHEGNEWAVSLYTADASGCEAIKAAETGKSHYIKKIMIYTASTITIDLGSGGDGGTAVTTPHFLTVPISATTPFIVSFGEKGMKLTSGLSFAIDASGAGAMAIYVEGKTCRG